MGSVPQRIVIGCDTFTPQVNGAARFAERLAAGLARRGHDVHVVAPSDAGRPVGTHTETVEGIDLTVHRLKSHKLWGHEWIRFVYPGKATRETRALLERIQPDVVHNQSHILIGRGLAINANNLGIRLIATNHTVPENILDKRKTPQFIQAMFEKWVWQMMDGILTRAAEITTPTQYAANLLTSHTTRKNVTAVSCGIESKLYTPQLEPKAENRIVFVGRLNAEKQVDVILRALARLNPELNAQFDVIGGGDQQQTLEHLAEELGISDRVHWLGRTTDEEIRTTLTRAKVFTIASIADLQSLATMEAMSSGLPILAADAMALPHLVNEGENGHLFKPGDYLTLAEQLNEILTLPHERYQAMQRASLDMITHHDFDASLDAFETIYTGGNA